MCIYALLYKQKLLPQRENGTYQKICAHSHLFLFFKIKARQAGRDSGVGSDVLYTTLDEPFGGKAHAGGAGVGDSEGERKHEDGGGGGGRASKKMHHEHA